MNASRMNASRMNASRMNASRNDELSGQIGGSGTHRNINQGTFQKKEKEIHKAEQN